MASALSYKPEVYCKVNKVDNNLYGDICLTELNDLCGERSRGWSGRGRASPPTDCSTCIANHSAALESAGCSTEERDLFCASGGVVDNVCGQPAPRETECPDNPEYCIFNDNGVCNNPAAETKVDCLKLNGEWTPNSQGYCEMDYIRMYKKHNELCSSASESEMGEKLTSEETIPKCLNKKIEDYCKSMSNDADIGVCNKNKYCTVLPNYINIPEFKSEPIIQGDPGSDTTHQQMEKYCWNKDFHTCEIQVGTPPRSYCKWDTKSKSCYSIEDETAPRLCSSNCFSKNKEDCIHDYACDFDSITNQCMDTNVNVCRPSLRNCFGEECDIKLAGLQLYIVRKYLPYIKSLVFTVKGLLKIGTIYGRISTILTEGVGRAAALAAYLSQLVKDGTIYIAKKEAVVKVASDIIFELLEINAGIVKGICLPTQLLSEKKIGGDNCDNNIDCYSGNCRNRICDHEYYTLINLTRQSCIRGQHDPSNDSRALRDWIEIPSPRWSEMNSQSLSGNYDYFPTPPAADTTTDNVCPQGYTGDRCDIKCCTGHCNPEMGAEELCKVHEDNYGGTCKYEPKLNQCVVSCPKTSAGEHACNERTDCTWKVWKDKDGKDAVGCRSNI